MHQLTLRVVSIPAYAGNTSLKEVGQPVSLDHPRACGEHEYYPDKKNKPGWKIGLADFSNGTEIKTVESASRFSVCRWVYGKRW